MMMDRNFSPPPWHLNNERSLRASCWSNLNTEGTQMFLHHTYTFIRNCCRSSCDHSWICTHVFLWNTIPFRVLIVYMRKTLRCRLSSRHISTDKFHTSATFCIINGIQQMHLILYWRLHNKCTYSSTNSFLYAVLAEFYTDVYTLFVPY